MCVCIPLCTSVVHNMSMLIIDLYSTELWKISTALCVQSGNDEICSFSATVWSCCCWAPGHGDCPCPVRRSRPSDQRQRRPDDRKRWAGKVVRSGDVEWLTVNDVDWECLRLVYSSRPGTLYNTVQMLSTGKEGAWKWQPVMDILNIRQISKFATIDSPIIRHDFRHTMP